MENLENLLCPPRFFLKEGTTMAGTHFVDNFRAVRAVKTQTFAIVEVEESSWSFVIDKTCRKECWIFFLHRCSISSRGEMLLDFEYHHQSASEVSPHCTHRWRKKVCKKQIHPRFGLKKATPNPSHPPTFFACLIGKGYLECDPGSWEKCLPF